jgi:hypothetical protein
MSRLPETGLRDRLGAIARYARYVPSTCTPTLLPGPAAHATWPACCTAPPRRRLPGHDLLSWRRWPPAAIGELLGWDPATERRWIHRHNQHGVAGLCDRPHCGRPRLARIHRSAPARRHQPCTAPNPLVLLHGHARHAGALAPSAGRWRLDLSTPPTRTATSQRALGSSWLIAASRARSAGSSLGRGSDGGER